MRRRGQQYETQQRKTQQNKGSRKPPKKRKPIKPSGPQRRGNAPLGDERDNPGYSGPALSYSYVTPAAPSYGAPGGPARGNANSEVDNRLLSTVSQLGAESAVRQLLDQGASLDAKDERGLPALHIAALNGSERLVRLLLERKPDTITSVDEQGKSALHHAVMGGNEAVVQFLLVQEPSLVSAADNNRSTPLHETVNIDTEHPAEATTIARLLHNYGADISAENSDGQSPFFVAASHGRADLIQLYTQMDPTINVDCRDNENWTPLMDAASRGKVDAVATLISLRADPNAEGGEFGNALQAAAAGGRTPVVRLLLSRNVEPHTRSGAYGYALQAAAFNGKERVVRVLVEAKADIDAKGGRYKDAIEAAKAGGHPAIAEWLMDWKNGKATIQFNERVTQLGSRQIWMAPKSYDEDDTDRSVVEDDYWTVKN